MRQSVMFMKYYISWSNSKYMDTYFKNHVWKKIGEQMKSDGNILRNQ